MELEVVVAPGSVVHLVEVVGVDGFNFHHVIFSAEGDDGIGPAMEKHGDYLENALFYVQYYLIPKELWAEAKAVLEKILVSPIEPYPLMNSYCQVKAAQLLSEVRSKL